MCESGSVELRWTESDVHEWARKQNLFDINGVLNAFTREHIDGKCLLTLSEHDLYEMRTCGTLILFNIGDLKRLWIAIRALQRENYPHLVYLGLLPSESFTTITHSSVHANSIPSIHNTCNTINYGHHAQQPHHLLHHNHGSSDFCHASDVDRVSPPLSIDGRATSIQPELFKTVIGLGYAFLVTWITAFVMVVVHERVPDMKRYPPLPDIFLDNVPHIPWAFHMCEITGTLLFTIWICVLTFHRHRTVLLRRFFALCGTVFLLRCVTMLITSLSVPGTHLQCNPDDYKVDDTNLPMMEAIYLRISRAYTIWSGLGMSIQGVRTCGDYMFSGHTVALTILNFFITEYTPRNLYFLHTMTWLLNMFGIFFILAAHEHYSIDVFVAFYITSRLFLYYHTLANNQALMSHDSNRTRIWFPMFSYFESSVDGIIPNEYDTIEHICGNLFGYVMYVKDCFMLTTRRFWITPIEPISKRISRSNIFENSLKLNALKTITARINRREEDNGCDMTNENNLISSSNDNDEKLVNHNKTTDIKKDK